MNNSLVFGKDSSNVSRAAKCTTDGKFIMDIDKSNDVATETTLRQVKTAIENIDVNVGDITLGEITVASNDTETHQKLDINNGLITSTNAKLDTLNTTLINKHLSSGTDSISVNTISGFSLEGTQQEVSGKLTTLKTTIEQKHLSSTTDSVDISGQSVSVSNMISGFALDSSITTGNGKLDTIYAAITNKHLNKLTDSVDISGQSVNVNTISGFALETGGNLTDIKINIDKLKYVGDDLKAVISNTGFNCNNIASTPLITGFALDSSITTGNSKLDTINAAITNKHLNKTNDSVDISGQSVNVNTISGFALETGGNLADIKINSDKLKYVGDDLKAVISNTGFNCNNIASTPLITGFALDSSITTGNSKLDTINTTISDKHLNKTTDSVDISGQSVNVNTISGFATETTLGSIKGQTDKLVFNGDNLKTELSNQITGFSTETTLSGVKTQTDKFKFNGDNLKTEIGNQITGFATETTLAGIKGQTDKLVFNGDDLKTTVSNMITGFSTETTLAGVKGQTDKLKFNGDDLKSVISNTSFESKLRDGNNNIITSTAYGIDGVRGLDVSIKNATQAEPLNVAIDTTTLPLNVAITNYPVSYEMSAGGALSSVGGSLYTNLRDATGNSIGIGGNPLNVEVSNSIIVETGTNALDVNITGGTIGADGKAFLYSGDEASSISATTVGGKTGIDSNIINSSIDTHCYGSSNGTAWHHLSTDANGQLNIHSKIQDGAGTDITSTALYSKTSLDVASDMYADFSGTRKIIACDTNGKLQVNSFLKDAVGNNLTSTDTTATTQSLDTASCLYTTDASIRSALTSTAISSKRALDVNVSNSSAIPVSGTFYPATQTVSGSVNIGTGAVVAGVTIIGNDIPGGDRGVITASCLYAKAPAISGVPETPLTCIINGSRAYLETRDEDANTKLTTINSSIGTTNSNLSTTNSTLSTINGKLTTTTNDNSVIGLNVYQIYPKKIIYPLTGNSSGAVSGQFIGAGALAYAWTNISIGLNYPRTFNIYHGGTGNKYVDVDYVNSSGDLATASNVLITTTNTTSNLTNAININSIAWSPTSGNADNTASVTVKDTVLGVYRNNINTFNCGSSIITCPNGYVGVISDLYCYTSGGDDFIMIVKDKYNNIKHTRYMAGITPANNKYYPVGSPNYPLYAGDSVFFAGALSTGGSRHVNAIVTLTAI